MKTRWCLAGLLAFSASSLVLAGGANFDFLTDADRNVLQERFVKELWPLMERGGKEGCIGCHALPKTGGAMKVSGNAEKDFRFLVKEGFFLPNDAGSMLAHIQSKDRKKRMPPPGKGEPWTEKETEILHRFVVDLGKMQQKRPK
jgi:hypothetical protein